MTATIPKHEIEVLAARNRRTIAEQGLPDGWLTDDQANALMISAAIDRATDHAERAFLETAWLPVRSRRAAHRWMDCITTAVIGDMLAEIHRAADMLGVTPEQRLSMETRSAHRFDFRLVYLRAFAAMPWGTA